MSVEGCVFGFGPYFERLESMQANNVHNPLSSQQVSGATTAKARKYKKSY